MLHVNVRQRIAVRAAAAAMAWACAFLACPVLAAQSPATVLYSCRALPESGETAQGAYPIVVNLVPPDGPVVGAGAGVTWQMTPAIPSEGQTAFLAPRQIDAGDVIAAEGLLIATGTPVAATSPTPEDTGSADASPTPTTAPSSESGTGPAPGATDTPDGSSGPEDAPSVTLTARGSATAPTALAPAATLSPLPDLVATLTPAAEGVVEVFAGDFTLRLVPAAPPGEAAGETVLYTCAPPSSAKWASVAFTVQPFSSPTGGSDDEGTGGDDGAPTTPGGSPTPETTVTATVTAPATVTATVTVTASPTAAPGGSAPVSHTAAQVETTPAGAVQTGGGGEIGPDGRPLMLTGTALVLAAATGGLLLRRRNELRAVDRRRGG